MGITIDASLNKLQEMHNIMEYEIGLIKDPDEKAWNRELINSIDVALDTMRKYQKIEQIIHNKDYEWGNTTTWLTALNEIKEVIENGENK